MYAAFLSFSAPSIWSFLLCHPVFCENLIYYGFINIEGGSALQAKPRRAISQANGKNKPSLTI